MTLPRLLTPSEVARTLRIAPATVRRMVKRGELRGYRVGNPGVVRVDAEAVRELLEDEVVPRG